MILLGGPGNDRALDDSDEPVGQRIKDPLDNARVAGACFGVRWRRNSDVSHVDVVDDIAEFSAPNGVVNEEFVGVSKTVFNRSTDHACANDSNFHAKSSFYL